jgi:hypothetical protein
MLISRYPFSRAPRASEVVVRPCSGTWRSAEVRMVVSVGV